MQRTILWSGIVVAGLLLLACAQSAPLLEKSPDPEALARETKPSGKQSWQAEWDKALQEGKKEGVLTVVGGTTVAGLKDAVGLFKDRFGIELLLTSAKGAVMVPKILQERRAGLYLEDVIITGHTDLFDPLKPSGAFGSLTPMLVLPEVLDQKLWYDDKIEWGDREGRILFNFNAFPYYGVYINTDLVKPGEIQSYYDLLNPKWQGQIVVNDPTISGQGNALFNAMVYNKMVDVDFFRRLVAQQPVITRDQDLQVTWVAKGKYPIALWPSPGATVRFIEAGAPMVPILDMKEGVVAGSSGSALGLLDKAPHPNAARVFINWFLSKQGQTINQKLTLKQTRRVDVPPEPNDPFGTRRPGVKYLPDPGTNEEVFLNETGRFRELSNQFFAPLVK